MTTIARSANAPLPAEACALREAERFKPAPRGLGVERPDQCARARAPAALEARFQRLRRGTLVFGHPAQ